MLAHHSSNGCNLRPGDLLGSGTISGPTAAARACLLELTRGGAEPITLPDGSQRTFLQDGDEVTLRAYCRHKGAVSIGLGAASGVILPAR
jgi:fumarylacetoacetase